MILDKINKIERYQLPQKSFSTMVEFIKSFNINDFKEGKFEIDGDDLFGIGLSYSTKDPDECLWEAHRKYIDIHYVFEGEEIVQLNDISHMEVSKSYDEQNDYELFIGKPVNAVELKKGEFLILYPDEVHKTSIFVRRPLIIKKIVFKINLNN